MFSLNGKTALVTGASRGIGRSIAVELARAGARVAVNYQSNETAAAEVVREIEAFGGKAQLLRFDVANEAAVDAAIQGFIKEVGRLDILINNAGIVMDQLLLRVNADQFNRTFATNVGGAIYCAKAAIRSMARARSGRIINLSSVVAESGNPGQAVYSASKAALIGLTKTLAREYASRGVTVNAIAPGYIDTDMTRNLTEEQRSLVTAQIPLGRVGKPEEIASAALFLASDEAAYITGQVLRVNGGMYL